MTIADPLDPTPALNAAHREIVPWQADYPKDARIARHSHSYGQLIYASSGVMTVASDEGFWVVPPLRALWVPPAIPHQIRAIDAIAMRTLYIGPRLSETLSGSCCVIAVSPLLRELISDAMNLPRLYEQEGPDGRLLRVLLDQLRTVPVSPLSLPVPRHPSLKRLWRSLMDEPGDSRTLEEWASTLGCSGRTLARRLETETGLGFRAWRQQIRLLQGLQRLAARQSVGAIAAELGYDSPSAFIAMFKRALGLTPRQYFPADSDRP